MTNPRGQNRPRDGRGNGKGNGGDDKTNDFDMAADVNTTYGTIDIDSAGGIGAWADITIWFKM